jgi:hypothetical protein
MHTIRLAVGLSKRIDTSKRGGIALHINVSCHLVERVSDECVAKRNESRKDILTAEVRPIAPLCPLIHPRTI